MARRVYGNAAAVIADAAAEIRGESQGACRVERRSEGMERAVLRRLHRVLHREVRRVGEPGDVSIARGVYSYTAAVVLAVAAQICRIDKLSARRVQLRYEYILLTASQCW